MNTRQNKSKDALIKRLSESIISELKSSTYNSAMMKAGKRGQIGRAAKFSTAAADAYNREHPKKGGRLHPDVIEGQSTKDTNESCLRKLIAQKASESIREHLGRARRSRVLSEGSADQQVYNKWLDAQESAGADKVLDAIWNYLDSNTLEKIVGWLEEDGYIQSEDMGY